MTSTLEEHLDYLSLEGRSQLFEEAIALSVPEGARVADLGCGFGVLGIQCLRAGAGHVWGIDNSDAIEIARETVRQAGLADDYTCIRGSTFDTELPEKADVLICDHVGHFGFDYGIVPMLADARRRMLKPGGTVMPRQIRLVIAGVSSDQCRNKVHGWSAKPVPADFHWLEEYSLNSKHDVAITAAEICTAPATIGTLDLACDTEAPITCEASLAIDHDCRFDGLAGWFECELAEGVWMTNSPLSAHRIDRNQAFLPCSESFAAKAGDTIEVSLRIRTDPIMLAWTIQPPGSAKRQSLSTWRSTILTPEDLVAGSQSPLELDRMGEARLAVLQLVDKKRAVSEIDAIMQERHGHLFPSNTALESFVKRELARGTKT